MTATLVLDCRDEHRLAVEGLLARRPTPVTSSLEFLREFRSYMALSMLVEDGRQNRAEERREFRMPIGTREILLALTDPLGDYPADMEQEDLESWLAIRERALEDFLTDMAERGNPTGTMIFGAWLNAPNGYIMCDGSPFLSTAHADLFLEIGYTFGGSGTAPLTPDVRGRVLAGIDNMGGTDAGRLSSVSGLDLNTIGDQGGVEATGVIGLAPTAAGGSFLSVQSQNFSIVQPTMTVNVAIKT